MEKIKEYVLAPEALVMVAGSSIGTQRKFYDKGYWYKQNNVGYEGTSEYLASKVLSCSNIEEYVEYEKCKINGQDGCCSENFIKDGETYISLQRLYDTYHGGQLSEKIRLCDKISDRIKYVVDFVFNVTGLNIEKQLGKISTLDMLILNTDRHFNNIGIIVDVSKNIFRNAPVFDNGNSLLSNYSLFPYDLSIHENIEKVIGQPFSANLEVQAKTLGFGLKINYDKLYKILKNEPESRALNTLLMQLDKYKDIIKDNSIQVNKKQQVPISIQDKLEANKKLCGKHVSEKANENTVER